MRQNAGTRGRSVNILFTMLLFLVFVLCALFTVLIGGKVYENINGRMEANYTGSTALGYIANKVRQGDMADMVEVVQMEGTSVLQLKQQFGEEVYVTQIYYKDGSIRELFTDTQSGLTLADGLPVIDCDGLDFEMDGDVIRAVIPGDAGGTLLLSLRSGGAHE